MPESNTPVSTPSERSCVATTTTTVATITTDEAGGWRRRFGIEFQLNVPIETIIITATSAGMGILPTHGPSTVSRNSRNAPATNVERRLRPPEVTLITDCPIIAQPPMPPNNAAARSEEHTSELQSLMRISYAVFCLNKKKINKHIHI